MSKAAPSAPVLSTVLLSWNRSDLLRSTLESYRETIDVPFELFIVDNASDDDAGTVIKEFCARCPQATPILLDHNLGGEALNLGIERARGVYLHLCENDIEFLPGWSSHVLEAFEAFDQLGQLSLFPPVPSDEEAWVVQPAVLRHAAGKIVYEALGNVGTTSILRRGAWGSDARVTTISGAGEFRFPNDVEISETVRRNGYFVAWADRQLVRNLGHGYDEFVRRREYYRKNYESKPWLGADGWERRVAEFERRPKPQRRSILLPDQALLPEKSEPYENCREPFLWSMIDGWTAEAETLEFLYALVRLTKPRVCIETGTWHGYAAAAIGRALRENGVGRLHTLERDAESAGVARMRLQRAGLADWVTLIEGSSLEYDPPPGVDFLLLDSDLEVRGSEFLAFLPRLNPGAIVVFHDASPRHKVVRECVAKFTARGLLTAMEFPTPRGLVLARYTGGWGAHRAVPRSTIGEMDKPRDPVALVITGMHRSGTSALARVLNLHGVFLGESLLAADPANERGYWEHDELWCLDERILVALGREWSDPGRLPDRWWERPEVRVLAQELIMALRRDFGGKALWGVKDPRICRLMPLWCEAAGQMGAREHFVIVLRRPGEVAASLARRDGMSPERARALWLRYMLEAERHTRGASRAFITYDQLLADWRAVLARVVDGTGLDLAAAGDEAAAQVDEFLSPQLRHHRTSPGSGIDTGVLAERAEAVYEILAAEDGALDFATLDRAAEELDALEDAFAGGGARTIVPVAEPADRERGIPYREWCNLFGLHESDGQVMAERMMQRWRHQPVIHLIVVLRSGEGARLVATLDSLSTQLYAGWGLTVLAEEPCPDPLFTQIPNVEWRESKGDPAAALNAIVGETESDWVGLLCPGDRLAQHALFACADRVQIADSARLLYTDWDRLDEAGNRCDPCFERDADLDWFRTGECLGGLWLIRRDALLELGGFGGRGAEEARDLALRVFERFGSEAFGHVDEVLCHRPAASRAAAEGADTGSHRAVLAAHLQRVAEPGEIVEGLAPGALRVCYPVRGAPPVSLIVDTSDDLRVFEQFVESLRAVTQYPNLELVVVDCASRDEDTHEYFDALRATGAIVVSAPGTSGRAEAWNAGAHAARGDYLIFADRRAGFVQKDWMEILLGHAQREGVGIVAPRVIGATRTVMHSALILGFGGPAGDAFQGLSVWDPGHGGRALAEQGCSAVPPACLLVSRACFEEVGGFDAERFSSDWFSVDFCLRAEAAGRRTVWTPYALVGWQSPEPARPTGDAEQEAALYERWLPRLACDPFYHRDLSLSGTTFRPRTESTVRWNPVFHDRPRILGVPADTLGCGEYRILAPLNTLDDAARAQCGVLAPQEGAPRMPSVVEMERLAPDTLLLQGALHDVHLEALRRYRRFNRAFRVFDIEDLKSALPEKNSRRKFLLRDVKARTRKALALCDRLLAATEPLAEAHRGLIDDIRVVPIYLAKDRWGSLTPAGNEGRRPRVGWAGGQQHEGDLEILLPVVEATAREVDWVFFGMCPDALRPYVREVHDMVPFAEYPARLAALALDLAVAPLEDHPFNVAKSNLRLLEYGMLGWPVVCTDLEPYRGAPVTRVTNDPQCWIEAIRERVHDLDAARSEGARLHEWVLGGWMLEDHLDEWLEALSPDERTGAVVVGRSQRIADGRES